MWKVSRLLLRATEGRERTLNTRKKRKKYGPDKAPFKRYEERLQVTAFPQGERHSRERQRLHHLGVSGGSQEHAVFRLPDGCSQRQARVYRRAPLGVGPPGHAHGPAWYQEREVDWEESPPD